MENRPLALIKGAGDLASGVALCLIRAGYSVAMTETARPTVVRRTVAFADAVYEGCARVEGVDGVLANDQESVAELLSRGLLPVIVDPDARILHQLNPDLLVDAIMAKRNLGTRVTDAPAVVALGPGFLAGRDAHAVIETMRGPTLGQVIMRGEALPNTGIPAERSGFGMERVLRSPREGVFVPLRQIGDRVQKGEMVGLVGDSPVVSRLDGVIRGMLREGLRVTIGFKLGDVDPEATLRDCYLVSDKAFAIGSGVLRAAGSLSARHCRGRIGTRRKGRRGAVQAATEHGSLVAALEVGPGDVVALVGGGGKTAALQLLVEECLAAGDERRVLATTTTAMLLTELQGVAPRGRSTPVAASQGGAGGMAGE